MKTINLDTKKLKKIRDVQSRLMSYNIEMTEVTGGTFWKAYTPEQIAGKEPFSFSGDFSDFTSMKDLMQYYPPINLYDKKLRKRAKELGPVWVRVSGSWATKTYYDFDDTTNGKAPVGYASVLTKEQWIGVLDFVKAIKAKLLISVSNCEGDHPNGSPLDLTQTKKIFNFSHAYGVDIDAAEFMNEPNMLEMSGAPKGYSASDYVRDHDIFNGWVRENYPNCLLVGPCSTGGIVLGSTSKKGGGIESIMKVCSTEQLMKGAKIPLDVFSYHYYNGISERLASVLPQGHWDSELAHTDEYLAVAPLNAKNHVEIRDKYVPNGQIWVTESGDAGGGGNTWASTYLDIFRTLNELGSFAQITDGVIFHNTLASSDYGFLEHSSYEPRPNYYAVLLWNKLMGQTVFSTKQMGKNLHVYCHSHKTEKNKCVYLIINNSLTETIKLKIDSEAQIYTLSADDLRSRSVKLNGNTLKVEDITNILTYNIKNGTLNLEPVTCTFISINNI